MSEAMTTPTTTEPSQLEVFTGYPVKIEIFEGPMDLLLHLVKQEELDIYEVAIGKITQQYLDYLRTMEIINIAMAGDFLVLAATLLHIKSRRLLPPSAEEDEEPEPDEAEVAARLRQRLAQYRVYKQAAAALDEARQLRQRIYLRSLDEASGIDSGFVSLEEVSIFDMVGAVRKMLQEAEPEPPDQLLRPTLTVAESIENVLARLQAAPQGSVAFFTLVDMPATRIVIIYTFLAVLELIRRRCIRVHQDGPATQILVQLTEDAPAHVSTVPEDD